MSQSTALPISLAKPRPLARMGVHHLILVGIVANSFALYAYTVARYGHTFNTVDGHLYYMHARSWYFDGDCDYTNEMTMAPGFHVRDLYLRVPTPTGKVENVHPCAWSVLAFPFLVIADGLTIAHNALSATDLARDGYTDYYVTVVPLAHVLIGVLGMWATYAVMARHFSKTIGAIATAVVWAGTNVVYLVSIEPTMSHSSSMAFVAMAIWMSDTIRLKGFTLSRAVWLGLFCGMMTAVRYYNIVWVLVPLLQIGPTLVSDWRHHRPGAARGLAALVLSVLVAAVCFLPQILVNLSHSGTILGAVIRYTPTWAAPRFSVELFDPPFGLLYFYPLLGLCLLGCLLQTWRRGLRNLPIALVLGFVAYAYVYACSYSPGYPRRYLACFLCFVFGLAALMTWASRTRWRSVVLGTIVTTLFAYNIVFLVMVDRGLITHGLMNGGAPELNVLL